MWHSDQLKSINLSFLSLLFVFEDDCPSMATCRLQSKCPYGLASSPDGCPTCACKHPGKSFMIRDEMQTSGELRRIINPLATGTGGSCIKPMGMRAFISQQVKIMTNCILLFITLQTDIKTTLLGMYSLVLVCSCSLDINLNNNVIILLL